MQVGLGSMEKESEGMEDNTIIWIKLFSSSPSSKQYQDY